MSKTTYKSEVLDIYLIGYPTAGTGVSLNQSQILELWKFCENSTGEMNVLALPSYNIYMVAIIYFCYLKVLIWNVHLNVVIEILGYCSGAFQTDPHEPVHNVHGWELYLNLSNHDGGYDVLEARQGSPSNQVK